MLGELRYVQRYFPYDQPRLESLGNGCISLLRSIQMCAPELDLSAIRPIRFRMPMLLPGARLTRAVLSELRIAADGISIEELVQALLSRQHEESISNAEICKLQQRVQRLLMSLSERELVIQCQGSWSIKP